MSFPLTVVHPELVSYATDKRPIRASAVAKFIACPMQIVLNLCDDDEGGDAAQTGNLVHSGVAGFHKTGGTLAQRVAASQAALEAARDRFPRGSVKEAHRHLAAYTADKENIDAEVPWCEEEVRYEIPADPTDPTGKAIVILGHLDQVRVKDGKKKVWDLKTGDRLGPSDTVLEYLVQQSIYTLAGINSLDPDIEPGGIIYSPGYFKARTKVFLPLKLTIETCKVLLEPLALLVSLVRQGRPVFLPSPETCKWCDHGGYPKCYEKRKGFYG